MRAAMGLAAALFVFAQTTAEAQAPPASPPVSHPASAPAPPAATVVSPAAPAAGPLPGAHTRQFGFTRLVVNLPEGKVWADVKGGWFCLPVRKVTWTGGQKDLKSEPFMDAFRTRMTAKGFKVDGAQTNLFEQTASTSDYQVAGIINDLDLHYCLVNVTRGDNSTIKGSGVMAIEWQVYSTLRKTVVAKIQTSGAMERTAYEAGGSNSLLLGAFQDNVENLIDSQEFRKALAGDPTSAGEPVRPTTQTPISLAGAQAARGRTIPDAVGSVVMIFAGEDRGSGFLVSDDGLLLTDQHVVGSAKFVKVRWSDGIEGVGEVIRGDKVRDVALVKTDPRGRSPLRLRRDPPQPGDTVFAIGTPLAEKFQSTVTRGVVSANRTFDGLSYIQSDVTVNQGSSGGPLLDDKGDVVGLTEVGYRLGGAPVEINLFTPVADALDFLAAVPK